ncbi:MAG: hypothetical protein H6747_02310 [Deltaproteobacteria bacterium]|nr:hypothetical protein [Deltaproteobacteria bacterium]
MRHLHNSLAIRIGFVAVLAVVGACAEERAPEPTGGLLTDYASGVDAEFGIEAFQLTDPTLTIASPADGTSKTVAAGTKTSVDLSFTVANYTLGKINCYVDGKFSAATTSPSIKLDNLAFGYHTIGCVLVDSGGSELANAAARATVHVAITSACKITEDCDDGLACTQDSCIGFVCQWKMALNCCGSSFDCLAGESCQDPNTATSKCSACATNADCDDNNTCTSDVCDLSGTKGACVHNKTDPECCVSDDKECDDGLGCTVDSCDAAKGKCTHVQPQGTCCSDSECVSEDVCLVGSCVNYECRFGKDVGKPDCCSATTNPTCSDDYYCTIDKCDQPQPGGWTKCSHETDASKVGCCDPKASTNECVDGNSCTYDVCSNYQCYNIQIADCCETDGDCDDEHPCTVDKCTKATPDAKDGKCSHDWTPECCVSVIDCNDGKFCTKESCLDSTNPAGGTCNYAKSPGCCDIDTDCDDGKVCTVKKCVNYQCVFGKDNFKENCCDGPSDCNDGDACTIDSCDTATNTCKFVANGVQGCCNSAADCDDSDCTTLDYCDANNQCGTKAAVGKCKQDTDCNDGNECTIDACNVENGCGTCSFTPDPSCCKYDTACNDNKPCTLDRCVNSKCENTALEGCCTDDADATTVCDDNNACTIEYCLNNQCRHTAPKNGCCAGDGDCFDGNKCTTDSCKNITNGQGTCDFAKIPDCVGCAYAYECDDQNPCTVEKCVSGDCIHEPKAGCCIDKFDCDDGKACTVDVCVTSQNYCVHYEEVAGIKPCCTPANEATECASLNTNCAVGKCLDQPDGSKQCVAVAKAACTYELNYCQDFSSSSSLANLGWNPIDLAGTAKANWAIATNGGLGPDQYARFNWTPTATNYDSCLTTPVFQAAGSSTLTIQFDREFVKNNGLTGIRILGSLDGENADWTNATLIDQVAPNADLGPETVDVKLPPELSGSNGLRLAVCVSGSSTFNLNRFGIDNFCIAKGSAPYFPSCPVNRTMLAGKELKVPVKAKDPDSNALLAFSLEKAPSFAKVSTALYSWLDGSWNSTITLNPTLGDVGDHEITVKVTDGHLYKSCTFTVSVTFEGGVLVWKPSAVPMATATPVADAIKTLGKQVQIVDDLNLYKDLTKFDAIFVLLGVFPANHSLKESEIDGLKLFLSQGGRLYMEGGDTWVFDPPTTLHAFFKVQGILDSAPNGVTGPLKGFSVHTDTTQNPPVNYQWAYAQNADWNNINDQIVGKDVAKTANILRNDGVEKFWVQVAHDNPTAQYRTVASSVLFGGLTKGVDEPQKLMQRIFHFFDNGLAACTSEAQCDDGNSCTKDTCTDGACSHENSCMCSAQTALKCGDIQTKLVSNGGAATQIVANYPCAPGVTFSGKEVAYSFQNATSAPVTVKLTNVSSSKVRLFVLKATANGCDPSGCVNSAAVAAGASTVSFPAQENVTYYIVVDAEGASDSATFDIEINCAAGEICDDGKDNNGNGLADCDDWASCCGFPTCGEICDGIDNDCNGTVDDGCDDDSDGYCDLAKKVKKSALCKKSTLPTDTSVQDGDDCKDGDTSVNPGATEICGNGKDDNCNGAQDEEGASGCTNFYADLDGDGYGSGAAKCLCQADGAFKATVAGDCNDAEPSINPGTAESCATPGDDDCDGDTNDLNADGCTNFYTDVDNDSYGVTPFKCVCTAVGAFKAAQAGDCDDTDATLNPGKAEICNNIDDNCNGAIDEGCDDDKDGYCDNDLTYAPPGDGSVTVCPKGAGDTDDTDPGVNPSGAEICDGKDNDSNGQTDEGCDDDGDQYCDNDMIAVGKPDSCPKGTGDCDDTKNGINPGAVEDCATSIDENCNGSINDLGAKGCTPFFYDGDGDAFGTSQNQCLCVAAPPYKAINPGDCDDSDVKINPDVAEICDGKDNDCDGVVDNGCDDDKDGFCDASMQLVGNPAVCPSGGNDCNDQNANVNPSRAEVCGNTIDENCDGSTNALNATGCVAFYADADGDSYGAGASKCYCEATGDYKVTLAGDCNDAEVSINPAADELCDGKDNNCDGAKDDGCDDDGDGYCAVGKTILTGAICTKGGGDCNDKDPNVYKGKAIEICDGKDDDCNGKTDNGCDDDKDGYCDAAAIIANPPPAVCSKGVDDCDDFNYDVNPAAPEVCNNGIDDNCNKSQNDENAGGCSDFYLDLDNDSYGLNLKKCLCTAAGAFKAAKAGDCADSDASRNPGVTEVCDSVDNNCDGNVDEENATNCKVYYNDADKDGHGIDVSKCLCAATGTFTSAKKDDCNDAVKAVNPSATEICNDVDDNCNGQVDEGCNADGDDYCAANKTVVGFPAVCPKGGGDCNDNDALVSTSGAEICNGADDNCNGTADEGCDDDGDKYCDANMTTLGNPSSCPNGGGDCDDTKADINPAKQEVCGNTVDENCSGGYNDVGAVGCTNFWPDADGDNYGKDGSAPQCLCIKTAAYSAPQFGDCDDSNELINKGATELCDGVDNNCDGVTDEGCDDDKDGYCDSNLITIGSPASCPKGGGDCDDAAKEVNPGAEEICGNSIDEDCDNSLNSPSASNCVEYYYDGDGDGFGVNVKQCLCTPENGFTATKNGDCDDTEKTINPNATEICGNGKDDNCDNSSNEPNAQGCVNFYKDADKDGYGTGAPQCLCVAEGEYLTKNNTDCNDADFVVKPNGAEVCDGKDNNCNGQTDEGCDDDNDGHCDANMKITATATCLKSTPKCDGVVFNSVCYQAFPTLKGWADAENQCTTLGGHLSSIGSPDENNTVRSSITKGCGATATAWIGYNDFQGEGTWEWVDSAKKVYENFATGQPINNLSNNSIRMTAAGTWEAANSDTFLCYVCKLGKVSTGSGDDCNDQDDKISPSVTEVCDDKDNNCDGKTDDGCDNDNDGFCAKGKTVVGTPAICTSGQNDCDDNNNLVNPNKTEICDGYDNNCNGQTDEGCDDDGDQYCDSTMGLIGTPPVCPKGGNDCADTDNKVNPGAQEVCGDAKDNNCVGGADEICNDEDGDGYCKGNQAPSDGCPKGGGDCDDTNKDVFPGNKEDCATGIDDNCDGVTNEKDATGCSDFYLDEDKDGFGAAEVATEVDNLKNCTSCGTGKDGDYVAATNTTLTAGTYEFKSFTINAGVTVTVTGSSPLVIKVQNKVTIAGTLDLSGKPGAKPIPYNSSTIYGGKGGPGGFDGANGVYGSAGQNGQGAGAGGGGCNSGYGAGGGGGGYGTSGQIGGTNGNTCGSGGSGGSANGDQQLSNLVGGSGGGSGGYGSAHNAAGGGGGGGGGAIRIDAKEISITGSLLAKGGDGGIVDTAADGGAGGGGAGGAIWLRAETITNNGTVSAAGGKGGTTNPAVSADGGEGGNGGAGRIRVDAVTLNGSTTPAPYYGDGSAKVTKICQCTQNETFSAKIAGDCNDTDATVNPNATEICDGIDNSCSGKVDTGCDEDNDGFCATGMIVGDTKACPKTGTKPGPNCKEELPAFVGSVINMETYSHGGGYHSFHKQWWYNNWTSGTTTVYKYDGATRAYVGSHTIGQQYIMANDGDAAEDAWYIATWYEGTRRVNGQNSIQWTYNPTNYMGGVQVVGNSVYTMYHANQTVYVLNKANGALQKTYNLSTYTGNIYGGLFIRKDKLWRVSDNTWAYRYDLATGKYDGVSFQVGSNAYNGGFNKDQDVFCISPNNASNYCYKMGEYKCSVGDDCNDKKDTINPDADEICDDIDNNCNTSVDEGCDDDNDGFCDADAALPFGDCCQAHSTSGCSVKTIQDCVCAKPGYGICCTGEWTADCANATKVFGCDIYGNGCDFPAACPAGGGDCNDSSNQVKPGGKEICGTADDDNCNGTTNDVGATGCTNYYMDNDGDGFGSSDFKCLCAESGKYSALVSGDCDDNDPKTYAGFATELCDGLDNNCNGTTDELCDADGDGYCDAGKIVITNAACPKSQGSQANCGDSLLSTGDFSPRTVGVNPYSTGGGYHPKLKEFWMPEYTSAYATNIHRFTSAEPYKELGQFNSGLRYVRQIAGDPSNGNWYAATYDSSTSAGLYKMQGQNNTKVWTSANLTTYLSGVAVDNGIVYAMRYNSSQVYAVNASNGARRTDKEFSLNSQTGYTYGIGFYDGKFYRSSDNAWVYRYDIGGAYDNTRLQAHTNMYSVAFTDDEVCYSNGTTVPRCLKLPKASESYGYAQHRAYHYSHGAGYHFNRKEYWYPSWSGQTVYRYDSNLRPVGTYNTGQQQMMQIYGDPSADAWYSANWGYNTITRRDGLSTSAKWSYNIGSTAGSCAVNGNTVYAMRSSGGTVWKINKDTGAGQGTFNLSGWWPGDTSYGGLFIHKNKLYRAAAGRWVSRHNLSGAWDGTRFYLDTNPYSLTYDGKQMCYSPNNSYSYCNELPDASQKFDIYPNGAGGSYTPGYTRALTMDPDSYGSAWNPQKKEYWFPAWTSNQSTSVRRYNTNGGYLGNTSINGAYIMDLWIDQDGSYATANWGEGRVRRFNSGGGNTWNYSMGGTIGGVTGDADNVYGMRYNSTTVWVINKANGAGRYTFGLNGGTTSIYGGLEIVGDTLAVATTNNYVRLFNKHTGDYNGVSFRTHLTPYMAVFNGTDYCVGGNSSGNQTFYCYGVTDDNGDGLRLRSEIRNYARSHGAGYHPYFKEYWYPNWSGDYVYRYNTEREYVGEFRNGRGEIMGLAGETANTAWYAAEWGKATISRFNGFTYGPVWSTNIGTTAGAVAVDANYVYGLRHGNPTVYRLNKSNGATVSTFNLSGGSYMNSTLYGGAAIVGDSLYRGNYNGWVERYSLSSGSFQGWSQHIGRDIHAATFRPDTREFCGYHNSYSGESFCMTLPDASTGGQRDLGMDAKSYGGGFHQKYNEYWYPEWNGNDSTQVYRYDANGKELGSFNSGLRNVVQIWGDNEHTDYLAASQNGSSTYSRVYRLQTKSANKVWTSPYVTTYLAGVTADKNFVYTMRYNSDANVYAFDRATGNRRTDKEFALSNWNGNTSYGIALVEGKFYRATSDNWVYRHDMGTGAHDGVRLPLSANPDSVAWNGTELCFGDNVTPSLVFCYKPENAAQNYNAKTYTVATYGEGGGFHNFRGEHWFPQWSSSNTNIYRYDRQKVLTGVTTVTQRYIRQIWGDTATDHWYSANWSDSSITKRKGLSSDLVWTFNIGSNPGGVAGDDTAVYAMRYNQDTVYVLNKQTGSQIKTFNLTGGRPNYLYGGLAVTQGKIFYGASNNWVYRYDLATGAHDNVRFTMPTSIYASSFDGTDYCIASSSSSNSTLYCVPIVGTSCAKGDDCDDKQSTVNPGSIEICDDADNNCDGTPDDGCDADGDDYCTDKKVVVGAPSICPKGGGDCNDASATENPASTEVCDGKDNNCDKVTDEEGSSGCVSYYYDGDQDGYGIASGAKCLCKAQDLYTTKLVGDCDDSCPECAPGKPEICDGKNNNCATLPANGSVYTRQMNIGNGTARHGSGYHPNLNEYWYTTWSGQQIRRFNTSGGYKGAFNSGQNEMMGLAGDYSTSDYYSANWGYGTVTRRKYNSTATVWSRSIGTYPSGVATDGTYVYTMKDYADYTKVFVFDRNTGADVAAKPHFNLSGGQYFSSSGDQLMYGGLAIVGDKIYRTTRNRYTYRYNLSDGKHDGVVMYTIPQSSYVDSSIVNHTTKEICVATYDYTYARCYSLPDATANFALSRTINMQTYSHGAGYHPFHSEYWHGSYTGGYSTQIYRFNTQAQAVGNFNSSQRYVFQIAGDPLEDNYYLATQYEGIRKMKGMTNQVLWTRDIGNYEHGVFATKDKVYAMRDTAQTVYELDRGNGNVTRTFNLSTSTGDWVGNTLYGGLVVIGSKLYRGSGSSRWIYGYNLSNGSHDGTKIYTDQYIYNTAYNGKEICISPNSATMYCYDPSGGLQVKDEDCDKDGDGYCDDNKVTVGKPAVCPKGGGDCNDNATTINPLGVEICNGQDENCNGTADEGADFQCEANKNAEAECVNGACKISKCNTGWYDLNGSGADGCECIAQDAFEPNDSCGAAYGLSQVNDNDSGVVNVKARMVDPNDNDWFKFYAYDSPDSGSSVCDNFNVRVRFTQNPSNALRFEVWRGVCPPGKYKIENSFPTGTGPTAVCCGQTDFNWFTNFKGYAKHGYSSSYSEFGECACTTNGSVYYTTTGYNYGPSNPGYNNSGIGGPYGRWNASTGVKDRNQGSISWGYDYTRCRDDSAWFYVRVYRVGTVSTCSDYQLEITNGVYGAPSTAHRGYGVY